MIPVLYEENETAFASNGLGRLSDALSCRVTEERNGGYELEMEYPVEGNHYRDLRYSRLIYAVPADGKEKQPFRIYRITKTMQDRVTVCAEHVSYQLSSIPVRPFTAGSAAAALVELKTNSVVENPFTFWTDIETVANYSQENPESIRARLGGQEGSILDCYGGEYEWDGYTVKLHNERGADRGVTLRYGKNLIDLTQEENIQNTYTAVMPFWRGGDDNDVLVTLTEGVVSADTAANFPYNRVKVLDLSEEWFNIPTEAQVRAKAQSYIRANNIGIPSVSLKVSFAALWQTEEYRNIAPLERVNLCDTVSVEFERLGVSAKAKVVKTVYNVLLDRYDSVEIGEARTSLAQSLVEQDAATNQKIEQTKTALEQAVSAATDIINQGFNGYVTYRKNANGEYSEILITDTPDYETATKVWRWNLNGLGYSSNGYNGPYTTAITMDGHIVADFVDTGQLTANIIKVGVLSDSGGNTTLNMSTGALTAKKLSVSSTNFTLTEEGNITAKNASLTNASATGTFTTSKSVNEITPSGQIQSVLYKTSLEAGRVGFWRNNVFVGEVGPIGGLYNEVDSNLHTGLTVETTLEAIALSFYSGDDAQNPESTYYFIMNNGLNPFGYTERFFMDGDVRVTETLNAWHVDLWGNGERSVSLTPGNASSGTTGLVIEGYVYSTGNMWCGGTKNRAVKTKNYGTVGLTAMESTYAVFSDLGSGVLDATGQGYIFFDPDFMETIELRHDYQVFITPTGTGAIQRVEKHPDYFIVYGDPGASFDWIVYARQRDYDNIRLERFDGDEPEPRIEIDESIFYQDNAGVNQSIQLMKSMEVDYDRLAEQYFREYESEVDLL